MTEAQLYVGPPDEMELAAKWHHNPQEVEALPLNVSLSRIIDSTHFENGDFMVVLVAKDSLNRSYFASAQSIVINKALLGDYDYLFATSWQRIAEMFSNLQNNAGVGDYQVTWKVGDYGFLKVPWDGVLPGSNFIYVTAHGGSIYYEMNDDDPVSTYADMEPDSHEALMIARLGSFAALMLTGFPPYDVALCPPANFIFVDSCHAMSSTQSLGSAELHWEGALYPKFHLYSGALSELTNQFVAGWKIRTRALDTDDVADAIADQLETGRPAFLALLRAADVLAGLGMEPADFDRPIQYSDWSYAGDIFAKVAGVYTGSSAQNLNWKL